MKDEHNTNEVKFVFPNNRRTMFGISKHLEKRKTATCKESKCVVFLYLPQADYIDLRLLSKANRGEGWGSVIKKGHQKINILLDQQAKKFQNLQLLHNHQHNTLTDSTTYKLHLKSW